MLSIGEGRIIRGRLSAIRAFNALCIGLNTVGEESLLMRFCVCDEASVFLLSSVCVCSGELLYRAQFVLDEDYRMSRSSFGM